MMFNEYEDGEDGNVDEFPHPQLASRGQSQDYQQEDYMARHYHSVNLYARQAAEEEVK
jgi:hypothetical protein